MKAPDFLRKGADLLEERGKQYDQPGGERSMGKAVGAFNIITGRDLTEAEGWLLLQTLKDVRQWQNPGVYHADSAEDCVSYAALKAEALATTKDCLAVEPASLIDDESPRAEILVQNGEMGEEVYSALDGWIKWEGGECPVEPGSDVSVRFRDGSEGRDCSPETWGGWRARNNSDDYAIIAYRPHKDAQ
jgi:hypothetical protein